MIFLLLFNGMLPVVQGWHLFNANNGSYNPASGWNATSIGTVYNCTTNYSSNSSIGGCGNVNEQGGLFNQLISGFGDWLRATTDFIAAFGVGVIIPGLFLVNLFHIPIAFAAAYTIGMYIMYASFFSYFFGFRSPEAGT
jgi:hypothetical protein